MCLNFDDLFEYVSEIERSKYFKDWQGLSVQVTCSKSQINSSRNAQWIVHKAIIKKLEWWTENHRHIDENKFIHHIYVLIHENICSIFINTSGRSLHERAYRDSTGKAPIKENLAASLVQLTNRNFNDPLIDPCCWSGTILIEAALIARNIAPGIDRYFAFEKFETFDQETFEKLRKEATEWQYDKKYTLIWSDIDTEVLEYARENAKNAWVSDTITFIKDDLLNQSTTEYTYNETIIKRDNATLISNPPYGMRITTEHDDIHQHLNSIKSRKSTIISWYQEAPKYFSRKEWQRKKTKNWANEVTIFSKK